MKRRMNSTDVVVEIPQPDHICNLTGNTGLRKPKPLYTLVGLLLPGTHFTTVLPVVKYSQGSHNLPSDIHPSHQGRSMFIYPMDHILLLGNLPGHHIVRAIDGSLPRIVPVTCRLDLLHPREGVVAAITTVIIGEVGMGVVDSLVAAEAAGSIMDSNLVFNRQ
jgi:hypothetical protein